MNVLTFGEIMLRLTPSTVHRLSDCSGFNVSYAGSECNVAGSLAILGNEVQFATLVPDNPLGEGAIRLLNGYGIDTRWILKKGDRLGIYFIELGASIRPSRVVYDRKMSSFSLIDPKDYDWENVLAGKSWLFVSGITAALSKNCSDTLMDLLIAAKKMKVKVAFDFNYRRTLWESATLARQLFSEILEMTDLLLGNVGSLTDVFDIAATGINETDRAYHGIIAANEIFRIDQIAFTTRLHASASQNELGAMYFNKGNVVTSAKYNVEITDRFGSGDAFAAAMIHGLGRQWNDQYTTDFAAAAFALKHTIYGDHHPSHENEIISIMEGNTSGHVIR